jgi:hypothetical protein
MYDRRVSYETIGLDTSFETVAGSIAAIQGRWGNRRLTVSKTTVFDTV